MKIASLAFALLLVACGSEDPPSCPEAVATYYGANCSFTDPGSGDPVSEDQAADRAHRIGQDRPVMVYRMVTKDTVEERILALQEAKRSLADAALGEADAATRLTRDDLLALLA